MIFTQSHMPPHFPIYSFSHFHIATFHHCNVISTYIKQSPTAAVYEWSSERSGVNGEALRMIFTLSRMTTHFPIYSFSHFHISPFSHFPISSLQCNQYVYQAVAYGSSVWVKQWAVRCEWWGTPYDIYAESHDHPFPHLLILTFPHFPIFTFPHFIIAM